MPAAVAPHVTIFLGTKNGAAYLLPQLESIASQTYKNWSLRVSDDGSSDKTQDIVRQFSRACTREVTLHDGPRLGATRNFMSMVQNPDFTGDCFAFSDQDDIWRSEKLERALNWLRTVGSETPALYCSRTELIDGSGNRRGLSTLFARHPSFQNALVQNIGGGNTMVFNGAARKLLQATGNTEVASHDWWTYQIVSGAGGAVFYDPEPSLSYRQHGQNVFGSNKSAMARARRIRMLFLNRMRTWNGLNTCALKAHSSLLTPANVATLDHFMEARQSPRALSRLQHLRQSGVYRQKFTEDVGLIFASIFNKL